MSFLDKINRFATNPIKMNMKRSKFNLSNGCKTTLNAGYLVPILVDEILPDDTVKLDIGAVVRSITPAVPVMDNAYIDFYAFSVPARLCTVHDKDWQKLHGENTAGFWAPSSETTLENSGNTFTLPASSDAVSGMSLADYMGIPIGYYNSSIKLSRLPFNGYWSIWNEWFRDENTQAPVDWKSMTNSDFALAVTSIGSSAKLMQVNKFHDYFTSALPAPQKGASVLLPLAGDAPVITRATSNFDQSKSLWYDGTWNPMKIASPSAVGGTSTFTPLGIGGSSSGKEQQWRANIAVSSSSVSGSFAPSNLYADLSNATTTTINDLRQGFAIQKLLEKDGLSGSRFREVLYAHFGISIPDSTVQVPEYLGGKRVPLNMMQVLQTSETSSSSELGHTGAFSNTAASEYLFTKSFTEHCYLYVLCCIRNNQSYSQGISKMWTRNRRYDFYYPVFANLGEQAIKKVELFANQSSDLTTVFGYCEAWAEYRFKPNRITGLLQANSSDSTLKVWTYQNNFSAAPTLNSSFMVQPKTQIGATLTVTSSAYQFIGDFWFGYFAWRAMPYFSIPGLIDHH